MLIKLLKDCISHFKNNTFFRKTVILYVVTGCMFFLLFGIFTTYGVINTSVSQINFTEQEKLRQSCNTANLVLRDIHSLANNKFSEDAAIREAMTEPYSINHSKNVQITFSEIMASSKLIDSIYVVNFKHDIVYSTQTSAKSAKEFFDADIISYLNKAPVKSDIFFSRATELTFNPFKPQKAEYITSVYRNSPDCALVVNLNQKSFQSIVNLVSNRSSYETVVLNSDGIVISHSNPENFAKDLSEDKLFSRALNSGEVSGCFKHSGASVNYVRSDTLGYVYLTIQHEGISSVWLTRFLIYLVLFTIILLIMYLICSMLASLNTYSLFYNLKKNIYNLFNKNEDGEPFKDEVENISHLLKEVKTSYSSMETMQYQYVNSKQKDTLKKLLTGTFAYLQDDMLACDISFPYNGFAVVVIRIDNLSKMDSDTIYTLRYAIMNMGKEIFENQAKAYVSEINENDIEFILNFMTDDFIKNSIEKLNSYMQKFFNVTFSAAYDSSISESLEDISVLYHNAKHALSYKLAQGHSSIITYNDIKELDTIVSSYPEELEGSIIKAITTQNDEELIKNTKTFVSSLAGVSFNMIILYTDRLLLAIDQFSINSNMSDSAEIMPTNTLAVIQGLETLDEIEEYILIKCRSLMLKFSNTKFDSKKDIMIKDVLNYIEENYTDPNLSIDMIAGYINRSANYTRSIFKQSQGISISDYIAKKRFNEVCRLLIETNLTANEIGKKLGLNSGSYFYTSFKKHTGYTPDQYRKLYHKDN